MKTKIKTWLNRNYFFAIASAILFLPALFTQSRFWIFNFSNSGEVGDTIGGITAPFIGLLSAYFINLAFREQVEANRIQSRNNELTIALNLINDLETKLTQRDKKYESSNNGNEINNANFYEIIRFYSEIKKYRIYYTKKIASLMRQVKFFAKFVKSSQNLSITDKALLLEKAALMFGEDLHEVFGVLLTTAPPDLNDEDSVFYRICEKFHNTTLEELLFHSIAIEDFNE